MLRFHDYYNGVNDSSDTKKSTGKEPKKSRPNFPFIETVQTTDSGENENGGKAKTGNEAKDESYPFIVFTFSGHVDSFFNGYNLENCVVVGL